MGEGPVVNMPWVHEERARPQLPMCPYAMQKSQPSLWITVALPHSGQREPAIGAACVLCESGICRMPISCSGYPSSLLSVGHARHKGHEVAQRFGGRARGRSLTSPAPCVPAEQWRVSWSRVPRAAPAAHGFGGFGQSGVNARVAFVVVRNRIAHGLHVLRALDPLVQLSGCARSEKAKMSGSQQPTSGRHPASRNLIF